MDQGSGSSEQAFDLSISGLGQDGKPYKLDEAAALVDAGSGMESETTHRWEQQRCYGFEIGQYKLLVPQGRYCELLTHYQLAALPNAPEQFLGLTNVRGNLVPVYQLEPLLGGGGEKCPYALVIGNLSNAAALAIAKKPVQFDLSSLEPVEIPEEFPDCLRLAITSSHLENGRVWSTINHEWLFRYLSSLYRTDLAGC